MREIVRRLMPYGETIVVAVVAGLIFNVLKIPLPWMLGPMTGLILWRGGTGRSPRWPVQGKNLGLVFIGYMIGVSVTTSTLIQIGQQLHFIALATILTISVSILIGSLVFKKMGMKWADVVFGSIPGGLSQVAALSEEVNQVDATKVLFMQMIRIITVIFVVPFLVVHQVALTNGASASSAYNPFFSWLSFSHLAVLLLCGIVAFFINKTGFPVAFLTGPLLTVAAVNILFGTTAELPSLLTVAAQVLLGTHFGLQMDPGLIKRSKWIGVCTFMCSLVLIVASLGLSYFLTSVTTMNLATAFLSTAPGGLAEMTVTGSGVGADLAMISGYQLFRILFILFLALPFIKWWFVKHEQIEGY
ncbi:AbrB family transcriptional regulator [Salibacterium aidingense]|uniref:AbrB family transcriptional regulator n=1 Tax=Salibacterium aidingense TaxID=384933 RepID=UPI00040F58CD|nr:AbrB family transcriptional regulator [Salibacterium aidingense]